MGTPHDDSHVSQLDIPGPHLIPQQRRVQAALEGPPLGLGGAMTLIAIQDPSQSRWALYPGGEPRGAFWVPEPEVLVFAARLMAASMVRALPGGGSDRMRSELLSLLGGAK